MMKIVQLFAFVWVVLLSACSGSHQTGDVTAAAQDKVAAGGRDAQSYALQQDPVFNGEVRRNDKGEVINPLVAPANQSYYFAFDSNTVKDADYQAIIIQARYLAAHPEVKVRLEGNTDNRGSREYNIALGWRRDQGVAKILEEYGVSSRQIDMLSYGKEHPKINENNEEAWQLNRRVDLVYEEN